MKFKIKLITLLILIFFFPFQGIFSQHISRDNYTGAWETPSTWDPEWPVPQTDFNSISVTINGYITANGSVTINGNATKLIVNDTLIIKGNLILSNNNDITVNDNGILIVMGNFTINNQTTVIVNGYLVVAGNLTKNSSQGAFTSNDDPVKVFIGGTIFPAELTNNNPDYPALNCTTPITTKYFNSTCSYGNVIDLESDPIFSFFQNNCAKTNVKKNNSACVTGTISLTSSIGTTYNWSGPNGFTSSLQNPSILNANATMAGIYRITVTAGPGCTDTDTIIVTINALPIITVGSNSPVCVGQTINLTSSDGIAYSWNGPNSFKSNVRYPSILNADTSMAGSYTVTVTANNGCAVTNTTNVTVDNYPVASAGPDQELKFVSETQMMASLSLSETGEWSLISGSGIISDNHSPTTNVTELSVGENVFLWKVRKGNCEALDEVKIIVVEMFVPSVITPNEDGKNDYFQLNTFSGRVELIIFNRWGNEEYSNSNYLNNWDGRNNNYRELPDDTYFYIIKFENGMTRKGTVLIKR